MNFFNFWLHFLLISFPFAANESIHAVFVQKCSESVEAFQDTIPLIKIPKDLVQDGENDITFRLSLDTTNTAWCRYGQIKNYQLNSKNLILKAEEKLKIIPPERKDVEKNQSALINDSSVNGNGENSANTLSYFLPSGILRIGKEYFNAYEYCISGVTKEAIDVSVCVPDCTKGHDLCVRKCCSVGTVLNILGRNCSSTGEKQWIPQFYSNPYSETPNTTIELENMHLSPHYFLQTPNCGSRVDVNGVVEHIPFLSFSPVQIIEGDDRVLWKLMLDGSVWWNKANVGWSKLSSDNYCVDGILNFGEGNLYRGLASDQILLFCPSDIQRQTGRYSYLYVTLMFVSSFFLLLTGIVYISLWDLQNVHGWTILSHVTSMFFMYIFLGSAYLYGLTHTSQQSGGACTVIEFINVLFRSSLSPIVSGGSRGLKRYFFYLAFAITVPSTVVATGLTLQRIYGDDLKSQLILPHYGVAICYVSVSAQGVYVYSIVGTLLTTNIILICLTVFTLVKFKRSTKAVVGSRSAPNQSFLLFVKLFIVMGITWVFEFISWADMNGRKTDDFPWYWVLFDLVNILQSVAIFVIFVCKRRILNQIRAKFTCLNHLTNLNNFKCWKQSNTRQDHSMEPPDTEPQTVDSTLQNSKLSLSETKI